MRPVEEEKVAVDGHGNILDGVQSRGEWETVKAAHSKAKQPSASSESAEKNGGAEERPSSSWAESWTNFAREQYIRQVRPHVVAHFTGGVRDDARGKRGAASD